MTVTLEPSEQLDGVQLSQSFDEDGVGCYTNPTPGTQNSECVSLSTNESELYPFKFWNESKGEGRRGSGYSGTSIWCKKEPNTITKLEILYI